jgi:hypothetical protein
MHGLDIPPGVDWELLVVNNNSTDTTDDVIERHSHILPIRRLFEPKPGKSHALNLAIRESRGEYILWTDDDVLVDRNWVVGYCEAFKRHPQASFFGGAIEPLFVGSLPPWLQRTWRQVAQAYAYREFGDKPIPFHTYFLPCGANLAIRADVQAKYCYDIRLGPRPNSTLRGEEVTILKTMVADGHEGWWVPDAGVRHFTPQNRQTTRFLRGYFFGQGEHEGLLMNDNGVPMLIGRPRWLWRYAIESEIRYWCRRFVSEPETWIEDLKTASYAWGRLKGYASRGSI